MGVRGCCCHNNGNLEVHFRSIIVSDSEYTPLYWQLVDCAMLPYCASLQYFQVNNSVLLKCAHIKFTLGQMLWDCETYCLLYVQCLVPASIMKCKSTEFYTNTKFNFSKFSDLSEVNWTTAASLSLQYSALEYDNPMDSYHCYLIVGQFWKWTWKTNIWELQIHAQSEINWTKAYWVGHALRNKLPFPFVCCGN